LRREVFLIFKESANNIAKHSNAKNVEIDLEISDKALKLQIKDDDKGFSPENKASDKLIFDESRFTDGIELGGNGILNMRRHAQETNGKISITSEIGKGAIIL
jgi:two-component system sensor histidine kinase DegS